MPIIIPGFGQNGTPPTPEVINQLRLLGVFPNQIRMFAGREDFWRQGGGGNSPWPTDGTPKYWCDPYGTSTGRFLFLGRSGSGEYLTKTFSRSDSHSPELRYFSHSVLTFYESRRLPVPLLQRLDVGKVEARRLSFPPEEVEDPADYPIAEVYSDDGSTANHTFPGTCLILIQNGKPELWTIEDAQRAFPVDWGPRPRDGVELASMLEVLDRACTNSAFRSRALAIKRGIGSVEDRSRELVGLLGLK